MFMMDSDTYVCDECGTLFPFLSPGDQYGGIWECEDCGKHFCTDCFIRSASRKDFDTMLAEDSIVRCADCYKEMEDENMSNLSMEQLDQIVDSVADRLNWDVTRHSESGREMYEFETHSDAGEHLIYDAYADSLSEDLYNNAESFDIDEHVEMWISARMHGDSSVPNAVRLVEDATEIEKMLYDLYYAMQDALLQAEKED